MRSIIKYARAVQFNWVPGLTIKDMAADLVSLLNDGIIAQWGVDTDSRGYRIDVFMPDDMVFELRRGDSLRFEAGKAAKSREAVGMELGNPVLEDRRRFDKCRGHLYSPNDMSDLTCLTACYDAKVVVQNGAIRVNGQLVHLDGTILATKEVVRPLESWESDETLCTLFDADEIVDRG